MVAHGVEEQLEAALNATVNALATIVAAPVGLLWRLYRTRALGEHPHVRVVMHAGHAFGVADDVVVEI